MKRTVNLKLIITVAVIMVTVFTVTLLISNGIFDSKATDESENQLPIGKYLHTSGDRDKYIEVYDDYTLQIFGYDDFFDNILNYPPNVEEWSRLSEEEQEENMKAMIEEIKPNSDWFSYERHTYLLAPQISPETEFRFVRFIDLSPWDDDSEDYERVGYQGLYYYMETRTLDINDENVYVYAG